MEANLECSLRKATLELRGNLRVVRADKGVYIGNTVTKLSESNVARQDLPQNLDHLPHGFGCIYGDSSSSEALFEGEFVDGVRTGVGILRLKDGTAYEGQFAANQPSGWGAEETQEQNRYLGGFLHGIRHGYGLLETSEGYKYFGDWEDGALEGLALECFEDFTWLCFYRLGSKESTYSVESGHSGDSEQNCDVHRIRQHVSEAVVKARENSRLARKAEAAHSSLSTVVQYIQLEKISFDILEGYVRIAAAADTMSHYVSDPELAACGGPALSSPYPATLSRSNSGPDAQTKFCGTPPGSGSEESSSPHSDALDEEIEMLQDEIRNMIALSATVSVVEMQQYKVQIVELQERLRQVFLKLENYESESYRESDGEEVEHFTHELRTEISEKSSDLVQEGEIEVPTLVDSDGEEPQTHKPQTHKFSNCRTFRSMRPSIFPDIALPQLTSGAAGSTGFNVDSSLHLSWMKSPCQYHLFNGGSHRRAGSIHCGDNPELKTIHIAPKCSSNQILDFADGCIHQIQSRYKPPPLRDLMTVELSNNCFELSEQLANWAESLKIHAERKIFKPSDATSADPLLHHNPVGRDVSGCLHLSVPHTKEDQWRYSHELCHRNSRGDFHDNSKIIVSSVEQALIPNKTHSDKEDQICKFSPVPPSRDARFQQVNSTGLSPLIMKRSKVTADGVQSSRPATSYVPQPEEAATPHAVRPAALGKSSDTSILELFQCPTGSHSHRFSILEERPKPCFPINFAPSTARQNMKTSEAPCWRQAQPPPRRPYSAVLQAGCAIHTPPHTCLPFLNSLKLSRRLSTGVRKKIKGENDSANAEASVCVDIPCQDCIEVGPEAQADVFKESHSLSDLESGLMSELRAVVAMSKSGRIRQFQRYVQRSQRLAQPAHNSTSLGGSGA